jgi:hypothetical protein
VGQAWADLASQLMATVSINSGTGGDGSEPIQPLDATLAALGSGLHAEAVMFGAGSWFASGRPGSRLVLVGGGETTVTGTIFRADILFPSQRSY